MLSLISIAKYNAAHKYAPLSPTTTPSPTPSSVAEIDKTSDCKTYINTDYQYSIQYPAEITISSTIKPPKKEGFIFFSLPSEQYVISELTISYFENPERLSAKAFYDKKINQAKLENKMTR